MNICLTFVTLLMVKRAIGNVPEDPSYFERVARSPYFVDKTMLLRKFYDQHNQTLVACPKNFGKTTNLDMIRRFFEIPYDKNTGQRLPKNASRYYKLFTDTSLNMEITQHTDFIQQHQGEHAVLYFNLSGIYGDSYNEILSSMRDRIREIFRSHLWLYRIMERRHEQNEFDIFAFELDRFERILNQKLSRKIILKGVNTLVEFLRHHFDTPVMVLVDDYDIPIMHALNNGITGGQVDDFIHEIFSIFAKTKDYVSHIMIFGRSRMFKPWFHVDDLHLFHYNYFLDDFGFAGYFGFTEKEIDRLLVKKNADHEIRSKIKAYFNGYRIRRTMKPLYQPKGVVHYLETHHLEKEDYTYDLVPHIMKCLKHHAFFIQACDLFSMKRVTAVIIFNLLHTALDETLPELVRTGCAFESVPDHEIPYFTPFLDNGYLSYTRDEDEFEIPNEIVEKKLRHEFEKFYLTKFNVTLKNSYVATSLSSMFHVENTTDEMLVKLADSFQQLIQSRSYHQLEEFDFYKIIFGAITTNSNVHANIIVKKENATRESVFDNIDRLKFIDEQRRTLLIIKLTYRRKVREAATEASTYVPHRQRNRSAVKMIKYLGINMNDKYRVEIEKGENRYDWYRT